jgi:hypothetical protein
MEQHLLAFEVRNALKLSNNGSAPGTDGLPYEFYKWLEIECKNEGEDAWDIMEFLELLYEDIETYGMAPNTDFNTGWMCPIYKKGDRAQVANYRPITLLNSDYKLLTKAYSLRLAEVAPELIHRDQAGFMKGRKIEDQVKQLKHLLNYAEAVEENGVVVGLDQEKAYDKIDHEYLLTVLEQMRFPHKFGKLVKTLYTDAQTRVMINGELSQPFTVKRGVRQGDPLSCLLFNLAIEPLACLIRKSDIKGISVPGTDRKLLISLFADDTTIYLSDSDSWTSLWNILDLWCTASTAKFNMRKTVILPFGSPEYRAQVVLDRKISPMSTRISTDLAIIPDKQTSRFLGAWIGNDVPYLTPWPEILEKIARDLTRWDTKKPTVEGRRHIINMLIGGRTQYLTRVQGMPNEIEKKLIRMRDDFLWEGKKARIAHNTMSLSLNNGGKQILDLHSRNEAIDLWNLKEFLRDGDDRENWSFFAEHTIIKRWDASQTTNHQGSVYNLFLQKVHIPSWRNNPLPLDLQRMISAAKKYRLEFTGLSISKKVRLEMPIWNHITTVESRLEKIRRKEAFKCLRLNHNTRSVADLLAIADRKTTLARQPHTLNPSGIARRNCGCPPCRRDRNEYGCNHPGECIEMAKLLLDCLQPKWNPLTPNEDLCEELALSPPEKARNEQQEHGDDLEDGDDVVTFDPEFRLTDFSHGYRIFASEDHTTSISTKRHRSLNPDPTNLEVFLHAKIIHPGEAHAQVLALILIRKNLEIQMKDSLLLASDNLELYPSFNTGILGGLLYVLLNTPLSVPLIIHSRSKFLGSTLVTNRTDSESNPLDPNYQLIKCAITALQERTGRTWFKKSHINPAVELKNLQGTPTTLDTETDMMFTSPGMLLKDGNQRLFTKIIQSLGSRPHRKSTACNLARIQSSIHEQFGYEPTTAAVWSSIRSNTIHRLTRNFLWKCIHDIYRVGYFWDHIPNCEIFGQCHTCRVPETLEHIMLECLAPGTQQIWRLAEKFWKLRYASWIKLNWGLLLGCGLSRFRSTKGRILPGKNRLFTITVSTSMHLIWKLRNERMFETHSDSSESEIHNRWVAIMNLTLKRDKLLTNRVRFGGLATNKQLVLNTWSGTLLDEDALPDDWTRQKGVLVGIWPNTRKNGIG